MPRISRDERSCVFCRKFGEFSEYFDNLACHNFKKDKEDPFVAQMAQVLQDASSLDQAYLSTAINLVDDELKKQIEVTPFHGKLLQLHRFLKRVQQSENDYLNMSKAERQEYEDLKTKHDLQRHEEDTKLDEIKSKIEELRDQIQNLKNARDELRQKRQRTRQEREEECENLRKKQREN